MELIDRDELRKAMALGRFDEQSDYEEAMRIIDEAPIVIPSNESLTPGFDVVDTTTGKYPDWERIAREEDWAKGLVYCDMDGIAIQEDGSLILLDECGNCVSCPHDRFEIRCPQDITNIADFPPASSEDQTN